MHDKHCPCTPADPVKVWSYNSASCLCVLIAEVRRDERLLLVQSIVDLFGKGLP